MISQLTVILPEDLIINLLGCNENIFNICREDDSFVAEILECKSKPNVNYDGNKWRKFSKEGKIEPRSKWGTGMNFVGYQINGLPLMGRGCGKGP